MGETVQAVSERSRGKDAGRPGGSLIFDEENSGSSSDHSEEAAQEPDNT